MMVESTKLQETIRENIERIERVVQVCSTESVVGYSMVKSLRGFPEVDLSSPAKQLRLLLAILLQTEEPTDSKEFTVREWEQVVEPLQRLGAAYMEMFVPTDESVGVQTKPFGDTRTVAMTAFLDYHYKALMATGEQVSDRIRSYLAPFDDQLSDALGLSATEALDVAHFIADHLQEQMDQLFQHLSKLSGRNDNSDQIVNSVRRLGRVSLADLLERFGKTGKAFWDLFSVRRGQSTVVSFPTDKSIVESKPLIHITNDMAMLFDLNVLFSAVLTNFEEALTGSDVKENFFRHRAKTLEDQTAEAFRRILGNQVEIYRNVFETPENQYEHDLVIVSQDIVLFVESKASPPGEPFRDPDRAFVRLRRGFQSDTGIQKGFEQSSSLLTKLRERELRLFDENGKEVLTLSPQVFSKAYGVCVTRDSFGPLATFLSFLISKRVDEPYPWVVNIFDLEQIADTWEYFRWDGRQLRSFLSQRILLHESVISDDELDYVGAFIQHCGLSHLVRSELDWMVLDPRYALVFDEIYYHTHHGRPRVTINSVHPAIVGVRELMNPGIQISPASAPEGRILVGRNARCPCDSGVKFKRCHGQ